MAAWEKVELCSRLLLQLSSRAEKQGHRPEILVQQFPPLTGRALEEFMTREGDFDMLDSRWWVHGPEIEKGSPTFWPVISIRLSGQQKERQLWVKVALFFEVEDPKAPGVKQLRAYGWRFEPPSAPDSLHCYHHAQAITHWRKNEPNLKLPVLGPTNTAQPAFPVLAEDIVGLLASVIVSLYGMHFFHELLKDPATRRFLKGGAEELHAQFHPKT